MKKRVLALLLAGIMIFNSNSMTAFAVGQNPDTAAEAPAEAETESTEHSSESQQATEKDSEAETEAKTKTEFEAETRTTVEAETPAQTEVETKTTVETETQAETENVTESESETVTDSEEETDHPAEEGIVSAEETVDFQYYYSGNNATISGYTGSDTEVSIPDTIDGYTVVAIGNNVFKNKTTITGITIPSKEYKGSIHVSENTIRLTINAQSKKGTNYTGSRTETMSADLIRTSDAKKVKIAYKDNSKYYYTGDKMEPEITIKDAYGTDISENFNVECGENTAIGQGTVTITGKLEKGYCDTKVLKFTILPRWMKWIF